MEKFKWICPNCQQPQIETVDPIDGPFLTCTCEKCGKGFDQADVRQSEKVTAAR